MTNRIIDLAKRLPFACFFAVTSVNLTAQSAPAVICDKLAREDRMVMAEILANGADTDVMLTGDQPWKQPETAKPCLWHLITECTQDQSEKLCAAAKGPYAASRLSARLLQDDGACKFIADSEIIMKGISTPEERVCWCLLSVSAGGSPQLSIFAINL